MKAPCACTTLRKATRAVTRFYDEAIERAGMTSTQLAVLRQVERAGAVTMARIADALIMDRTSLYRVISPLLRDGLLRTASSGQDARAKCLVLTPRAKARMVRAGAAWDEAQSRVVARIGAERWRALSGELLALAEDVNTWTTEES